MQAGVRFKQARMRNAPSATSKAYKNRFRDTVQLKMRVRELLAADFELVCVDECVFSW